jgi:hypothetical protein
MAKSGIQCSEVAQGDGITGSQASDIILPGWKKLCPGEASIEWEAYMTKKHFTTEDAARIGKTLGINWSRFDLEQFRMGLDVELEHGLEDPVTNVTNSDPMITGKIALAHLNEFPDYYTRLEKMEKEADLFWGKED